MKKKKISEKISRVDNKFSVLNYDEIESINNEKKFYENSRAASIEALKIVQKKRGWISDKVIEDIAQLLKISKSDLEEIATFYSKIFRQPVGRNIIYYCDSVVCYITGYSFIQVMLEKLLKIKTGQTTLDNRFTLLPTCCLGNCDKSPVMMINYKTYLYLTPEKINSILRKYQ